MKKPLMFLFTLHFPYGKGEEFIENEVPILSNYFDIIVAPRSINGKKRELPSSVKVDKFFSKYKKVFWYGITDIHLVLKEYIQTKKINSYKSLSYFGMEKLFQKWFTQYTHYKSPMVFYSYWLTYFAFVSAQLNKYLNNKHIIISRAHRADLYEFLYKENYIPLRREILKNIDKVFCVSEDGKNYLIEKYPQYEEKIEVSRLGVIPQNKKNIKSKDGTFRIVTCSYLTPVKRVHLVIDALSILSKRIKNKIIWTHIGDGPLEKELKIRTQKLKNTKIEYNFLGRLENKEVQKYYRENPVDLFLNVSESEGLPVSIMEALSFGIPVIATDVGGTGELVNSDIGNLVPANITPESLSEYIYQFISLSEKGKNLKRQNALKRWNEKVNAEKNYETFAKRILELLEEKKDE